MRTNRRRSHKAVFGAAYLVCNTLEAAFWESVYENALLIELGKIGVSHVTWAPMPVMYGGQLWWWLRERCFVEGKLVVEVEAVNPFASGHEVQLANGLKATGGDGELLINLASNTVTVKRKYKVR